MEAHALVTTPDVTLLIPCYRGEAFIETALRSVVAQTLEPERFEVVVAFNGDPDGSQAVCERVFAESPHIKHRYLHIEMASLSNARNVAIREARGRWITWVDVDDWLSPNFLEELVAVAKDGIVPLARVVDVDETTREIRTSPITEQILSHEPGVHDGLTLSRALGFAACKLIEVETARQHEFDVELRSGEDVAFFGPFFARFDLAFDTTPAVNGATYFRLVRDGSMSRQEPSYDFSVTQRLAVIRHLDASLEADPPEALGRAMRSLISSQTLFTARYLARHPEEYPRVVRDYQASGLRHLAWQHLILPGTTNLLISYNFPPFADASAITAAKRALLTGQQWNVVSNAMNTIRRFDPQLIHLSGPATATHITIKDPPVFGAWGGVESFCTRGLEAIAEIEEEHGAQRRVYSRAMWPASHFLAALHVTRSDARPHWTAEFSDPLRRDVLGSERASGGAPGAIREELAERLREAGFGEPKSGTVFAWAEHLAYALADELIFTNPHQVTYMLSYLEDARLRARVRERAVVQPHPTLPSHFYELDRTARVTLPGKVNIGYFGTFYANRGMGDVLTAVGRVDGWVKDRLALHVFSPRNADLEQAVRDHGLVNVVSRHDELPYLAMLGALRGFDCLLVTDADTGANGHDLNPYLPSKLSDYIGAGVPVWALVEPGSTLSRHEAHHENRLGDVNGMVETLTRLAKGTP